MKFAKGRQAVGECQRSGQKMLLRDMVQDGYEPSLLVHPDWYEPPHPQDIPVHISDPIALRHPAPELSKIDGEGPALAFDETGRLEFVDGLFLTDTGENIETDRGALLTIEEA